MSQHSGRIVGEVTFREGDGPNLSVPVGPCEINVSELDVTLSWTDGKARGSTAMPLGEYRRFVESGALQVNDVPEET